MSKRDGLRLAFLVAVGPYLAERGDLFYRRLAEQNGNLSSTAAPLLLKLKKIFKVIYPFLHMSLQGIHLMHRWKYLLGQSVFFDPYSQWLNLVVRRLTTEDQATTSKDTNSTKSSDLQTASNNLLGNTSAVTESIVQNATLLKQAAMVLVSSALAVGWLARLRSARRELLQQNRLRVTQPPTTDPATTSNHASSSFLESMPPPPPPLPTLKSASRNNCLPSVCPLCRQPRVHPTASTGGYVFCLKCLLAYVKERAICPITGKDCPESSIVRLYEPRRT
jgi:peroxin-12